MVIHSLYQQLLTHALLAQEQVKPVLERLDPPKRAAVLMTILGLVLTGLMLVAGVMIGAHWVRQLARQKPRGHLGDSASRLSNQRQRAALDGSLPKVDTSATVEIDSAASDTKIDRQSDSNNS